MSKSDSFETDIIKLIFNNTLSGYFIETGHSTLGTPGFLYVSLHTGDPGEAGNQNTNEVTTAAAYTNYARQAVPRTTAGWVAASPTSNVSLITFPAMAVGSTGAAVTHFGIGTASSGAGLLLYSGTISIDGGTNPGTRTITPPIAPTFAANTLIVDED